MEKIEKLEITPVRVPSAVRVGGECVLPTDKEIVLKVNELVDRVNALSGNACGGGSELSDSDRAKARELGKMYARQYRHNNPDVSGDGFVFSDSEIEKACLEMAEWKNREILGLGRQCPSADDLISMQGWEEPPY